MVVVVGAIDVGGKVPVTGAVVPASVPLVQIGKIPTTGGAVVPAIVPPIVVAIVAGGNVPVTGVVVPASVPPVVGAVVAGGMSDGVFVVFVVFVVIFGGFTMIEGSRTHSPTIEEFPENGHHKLFVASLK
jgi:hypothetical protein